MNPQFIVIHHSLTEDGQTVSWGAIRKYHLGLGWKDVGYHYGIELVGDSYEIFKGRMDDEPGAHCIGYNVDSIGICLVGNFDCQPPDEPQLVSLRKLCRSLMGIYGIKIENIMGHWETYEKRGRPIAKSCPGIKFHMPEFRLSL